MRFSRDMFFFCKYEIGPRLLSNKLKATTIADAFPPPFVVTENMPCTLEEYRKNKAITFAERLQCRAVRVSTCAILSAFQMEWGQHTRALFLYIPSSSMQSVADSLTLGPFLGSLRSIPKRGRQVFCERRS